MLRCDLGGTGVGGLVKSTRIQLATACLVGLSLLGRDAAGQAEPDADAHGEDAATGEQAARAGPLHAVRPLGDLDGDGRDDVLLRHRDGRWLYYPMDGGIPKRTGHGAVPLTGDSRWALAGIGDLDGDGREDVLLRHGDGRWHGYLMDGRAVRSAGRVPLPADTAWATVGLGDFDGDGRDDVLLRHEDGRWRMAPLEGLSLSPSGLLDVNLTRNRKWRVVGIGDLDGDDRDDVLLRREDGAWHYYPMRGARPGPGRGRVNMTRNLAWSPAGIGDFDGDGNDDVLLRHRNGRWYLYTLSGRRILRGRGYVDLPPDLQWRPVGVGDLGGDDRADVLLRHADGSWRYYAMSGRAVAAPVFPPLPAEPAWRSPSGRASIICPNGAPASDNPLLCERGNVVDYVIPGIDRLPLDRIQLTNEQMQRHFAIVETYSGHALAVGELVCESYVTASEGCEHHKNRAGITRHPEGDEETRTGLIPFTQILDLHETTPDWTGEQADAMEDLRILNFSYGAGSAHLGDADKPRLQIQSAGNEGSNHSWFLDDMGDRDRDLLTRAIAANKLLFVAGMDRNVSGDYIRDTKSSSCRDLDYGCFWTWFTLKYAGTSLSTANITASLASILSVFPDTSHQDLAKLARACAKKTGEGIDGPYGLLATSGGFGVADFSCMDEIIAATADLSGNETATLTIDGREVTVSPRALAVEEFE